MSAGRDTANAEVIRDLEKFMLNLPLDTIGRLLVGKATDGDQMLAGTALSIAQHVRAADSQPLKTAEGAQGGEWSRADKLADEIMDAEDASDAVAPVALTFDAFRSANVARCIKWHPAGIESWSPSDWLTAVTGELGELASLLKMRNRERDGLPGNKFSPTDKQVADELADVLTYLDLLAAALGVDLGRAAVTKFNEISERVGFPDRITPSPPHAAVNPAASDAIRYVQDGDSPIVEYAKRVAADIDQHEKDNRKLVAWATLKHWRMWLRQGIEAATAAPRDVTDAVTEAVVRTLIRSDGWTHDDMRAAVIAALTAPPSAVKTGDANE